ncbi:zinc-ribbon domain-containing protein [[Eubacterium] cellulosolvens]
MSAEKFCSNCGNSLPAGTAFCAKCGTAVDVKTLQKGLQPSGRRRRNEKHEKNEKQEKDEKHEKNEKQEKDEKHEKREGRGSAIIGGLVLIWLGVSFMLATYEIIPLDNWGAYFLSGLGGIIIVYGLISYSEWHNPVILRGTIIAGVAVLAMGILSIIEMRDFMGAAVLIVAGLAILILGISSRRRAPTP